MGWLWGPLVTIGLGWVIKFFHKVTHTPPKPLEVVIAPNRARVDSDQSSEIFPGAIDASLRFLHLGLRILTNLGTLDALGIPPSLQGAVWSWPQAFRSLREVGVSTNQLAEEVLMIRTLGSSELADAAYDAARRLTDLLKSSQPTRDKRREFVPADALKDAVDSLTIFRQIVRSELEVSRNGRLDGSHTELT